MPAKENKRGNCGLSIGARIVACLGILTTLFFLNLELFFFESARPLRSEFRNGNCQRVDLDADASSKHFVIYNDNIIITGSAHSFYQADESRPEDIQENSLYAIYPPYQEAYKLKIFNFPANVTLRSYGIHLHRGKILYLVNKGYQQGGERVLVLKIIEKSPDFIELKYSHSIKLPDNFLGRVNSASALERNEILITASNNKLSPPSEAFFQGLFDRAKLFSEKSTSSGTYHCISNQPTSSKQEEAQCKPINSLSGSVYQVLETDQSKGFFVLTRPIEGALDLYKLKKGGSDAPELMYRMMLDFIPASLNFDTLKNELWITGMANLKQIFNSMNKAESHFQAAKIKFKDNFNGYNIENVFSGTLVKLSVSHSQVVQGKLVLGSPKENAIFIC